MLLSKYTKKFDKEYPLPEYPRPHLVRDSYINLNGKWDFTISSDSNLPLTYDLSIIVPYCPESYLSGINKRIDANSFLFYRKKFTLNKNFIKDKVLLHIDACDQLTEVYINNNLVATSDNGYFPIICDIKPYLVDNENELVVKVSDKLDHIYPYGKQKNNNGGMWYTPVSGIWQSVWLESVGKHYINKAVITPDIDEDAVAFDIATTSMNIKVKVYDGNKIIFEEKGLPANFSVILNDLELWTPENPKLYDVEIKTEDDVVNTYFAYRKFSTNDKYFLLNNKPYFLHGLLDQGFYPDGIYTPTTYKAYLDDIKTMKSLGFNCLRKHIKVEPMMYYHYADVYGMIILQDVVNNGKYSFAIDTVAPTIGFKGNFVNNLKKVSAKQKEVFQQTLDRTLVHFEGIPSVAYLTIFNEGWGQHDVRKYYEYVKSISDLVIDSTSGWFKDSNYSDINSLHVYFKRIKLPKKSATPIIVSEFGGYVYKEEGHIYNLEKDYGYKTFKDKEAYLAGLKGLYEKDIIANIKNGLAGCIYTQVSDVEDEVNGLLTYDRAVLKVDKYFMLDIKQKIDKEFYYHD